MNLQSSNLRVLAYQGMMGATKEILNFKNVSTAYVAHFCSKGRGYEKLVEIDENQYEIRKVVAGLSGTTVYVKEFTGSSNL